MSQPSSISRHEAALSARASKRAMRVAVAAAKGRRAQAVHVDAEGGVEKACEEAMSKREQAASKQREQMLHEEEVKKAKAEKQAAKLADSAAKKQKKADAKQEAAARKAETKAEKALTKERKQYLGGMVWGYDPRAGVLDLPPCLSTNVETSVKGDFLRPNTSRHTSATTVLRGSHQHYDRVTGKFYRRDEFDNAWGIEIGGPTASNRPGPHCDQFTCEDGRRELGDQNEQWKSGQGSGT